VAYSVAGTLRHPGLMPRGPHSKKEQCDPDCKPAHHLHTSHSVACLAHCSHVILRMYVSSIYNRTFTPAWQGGYVPPVSFSCLIEPQFTADAWQVQVVVLHVPLEEGCASSTADRRNPVLLTRQRATLPCYLYLLLTLLLALALELRVRKHIIYSMCTLDACSSQLLTWLPVLQACSSQHTIVTTTHTPCPSPHTGATPLLTPPLLIFLPGATKT
jgi:hypothetical protein